MIGRAAIEAVLEISAAEVAGQKQPGKRRNAGDAAYHGRQGGRVYLADRAVRVEKPRLRSAGGEVEVPAYEALRRPSGLGERMLELLLAGLGTRSYGKAVGEMAETAGVSKSSVSRYAAEAAAERLKELAERRLENRDYLIVYVDGIQFGGHHVLAALGVDDDGNKRILGLREGASENAVVALGLLESLVERGLDPGRPRLFVLDGSKALRAAVGQVFGSAGLVQRCRNQKMRNVIGHLPRELHDQARSVLRAAWKLDAKAGKARIEQFASWVETQHPGAAGSLREGLNELFTVSAIGLAPALKRCLGTTNVIDNAHSGMRRRTGRVTRWTNGSMAVRWAAAAFLEAEKGYRRIMGYRDLWMLKAHLDELSAPPVEQREDAAARKTRTIGVRVTAAEGAELDERATASRLTTAAYVRRAVLGRPIRTVSVQRLGPAERLELTRIGTNLNQAVRAMNAGAAASPGIRELVERVGELVAELLAADVER